MSHLEYLKVEIKRLEDEKFSCSTFKDMFEIRKKVIQLENEIIEVQRPERNTRRELRRKR